MLIHKNSKDTHNDTMLIVFTRSIIIYLFLLIVMRLMGKKQLGELQPFEFTITLIAAELACIPMSDTQVPILYGLVPIFTLFVVEFLLTKIVKHSIKMRRIINGKPVIVITPDGIDFEAINRLDMTVHDIMESIRAKDFTSPEEIDWAIIETNGDMSVVPKVANKPVTVGDMALNVEPTQLPYSVICEGKKMSRNIQRCNLDENKLMSLIDKLGYKQDEILLLLVTGGDSFYLQPRSGKYISGKISEEVG